VLLLLEGVQVATSVAAGVVGGSVTFLPTNRTSFKPPPLFFLFLAIFLLHRDTELKTLEVATQKKNKTKILTVMATITSEQRSCEMQRRELAASPRVPASL
jgi:hypothetical protein